MLMNKKMKCPKCGRRAFDISRLPKEEVEVSLKCPQCVKFVSIPCNEEYELKTTGFLQVAEERELYRVDKTLQHK